MNKTDNIFSGLHKKEKQIQPHEEKRERKREKSFVLELKELKKEIDEEIRREIMEGKLDVNSCPHKRTNLTTINAKPMKFKDVNYSMIDGKNQKSKDDISYC